MNDELLREARRYSRASSKRALVEEALQTFIRVKAEEQRALDYEERVRRLDEKLEVWH